VISGVQSPKSDRQLINIILQHYYILLYIIFAFLLCAVSKCIDQLQIEISCGLSILR
jgi:hypothetical protein